MKLLTIVIVITCFVFGCNTSKNTSAAANEHLDNIKTNDTVSIANDDLEYEIIIIEPGFNSWLLSTAKPEGYYSQSFLEIRNRLYVTEWNSRALQPERYNPNLYEMQIDYQQGTDYGYEVNYKLYNYFVYFQIKYKQQLGPFSLKI